MSVQIDVLRDIIEQMEQLEQRALSALRSEGQPDVAHELGEKAEEAVKGAPESEELPGEELGEGMPVEDPGEAMGAPADLVASVEAGESEDEEEDEDEDSKKAKSIVSGMFGKRGAR
jgi:hypothetical protein